MLRNELIQKEMVDCSQTSKSKEQKHKNKDYLKHSIYSLLQQLMTKLHVCLSVLNFSDTILPNSWADT